LREDELDAACCKDLIPGVVLLPALSKSTPMTIGIGIAVGVAAFLIIMGMVASCIWFAPKSKKIQSSKNGNFMPKNRRDSTSTASTLESDATFTTYTTPSEVLIQKPAEVMQKKGAPAKIGMQNPYTVSTKIAPKTEPNQVPTPRNVMESTNRNVMDSTNRTVMEPTNRNVMESTNRNVMEPTNRNLMEPTNRDRADSVDLGTVNSNFNSHRKTIDLDVLDLSIPVEEVPPKPKEYAQNQQMGYQSGGFSNRDSDFYTRPVMAQSVYSNFQNQQLGSTFLMEEEVPSKPQEYSSTQPMEYKSGNVANRDSGYYTRANPAQSMYSNLLRNQLSEAASRGSVMEERKPSRNNIDSVYSMSTDHFAVDDIRQSFQLNEEFRDSLLSFQFPQPPSRPPIHEKK
jgi:hypothetical protein